MFTSKTWYFVVLLVDQLSFLLAKKPPAANTQHVLFFSSRVWSSFFHSSVALSLTQNTHTHGSAELLPVSWERALALPLVLHEWCIAPSMSLPLVSPPLLFSEPLDTVPWRSLSPGGRGEGLQKSRTRSSCALSDSVRPLSHNFTRAHIRHSATFPFPVARHSSPQTDGKGLKVQKRKTDGGTNSGERKRSCRQYFCERGEKNERAVPSYICTRLELRTDSELWELYSIAAEHERERERCGREQECGGAQRERARERKEGWGWGNVTKHVHQRQRRREN